MSGEANIEAYDVCDLAKMEMLTAAQEGNNNEVTKLITSRQVLVDAFDDDRVTALQIAAATGNVQLVTLLLEQGADIDMCNQVGLTAFHQACREGHIKVVEVLLQRGAKTHLKTHLGATALTLAASGGHAEVVKKLVNLHVKTAGCEGYSPTPLIAAAFRGNPVTLSTLVKLGKAPLHEVCERLWNISPLTCAVLCSARPIVSCLLEMGADPTVPGIRGFTAIQLAQQQKRSEIIEMFKEYTERRNINTEMRDLRQLIIDGDLEKMEKNIRRGESSPDGVPPVVFATLVNPLALRHLLLDMGQAASSFEPKLKIDGLMFAALFRDIECCELLISHGASPSSKNSLGLTAYDMYHVSLEEVDESVRASLSTHSNKRQSVFRISSNSVALSKMLTSGKHRFGIHERGDFSSPVRMRQWFELRMKTWSMDGINNKKLLLPDELLTGKREMKKKRERTLNRYIEVARSLVEESTSFSINCFYDIYNRDSEQRESQTFTTCSSLPRTELDSAVYLSNQYGYRGVRREPTPLPLYPGRSPYSSVRSFRLDYDMPSSGPRVRRSETTAGGTTIRTTPRMLKKSRESTMSEEARSLGSFRSLVSGLTTLEENHTIRSVRSSSTPHLAPPVLPRRSSPYSHRVHREVPMSLDAVWDELNRRGLKRVAQILQEQEVTADQISQFEEANFREMGITNAREIEQLMEVRRSVLR